MRYNKCFLCGRDHNLNKYKIGAYEISCEDCGKAIITYCCFSSYDYNTYKEEINKNIKNYLKNNKNNGLCITNHNISQFIDKK